MGYDSDYYDDKLKDLSDELEKTKTEFIDDVLSLARRGREKFVELAVEHTKIMKIIEDNKNNVNF
jgi:hypothetical protein